MRRTRAQIRKRNESIQVAIFGGLVALSFIIPVGILAADMAAG